MKLDEFLFEFGGGKKGGEVKIRWGRVRVRGASREGLRAWQFNLICFLMIVFLSM